MESGGGTSIHGRGWGRGCRPVVRCTCELWLRCRVSGSVNEMS